MSAISGFRRIDMQIDHANQCFIDTMLDAHEGDYNGRTLRVQLTDGGAIKNTSGIKLNFGFMHTTANKNGVYAFQLIDASQGIYEVAYPKEMLVPGNAVCAIQVVDGSSITSTKNFVVKIEKSIITNDVIVAENSPTVIEKALMNIADHEARVSLIELNFDNMLKLMTANIPNMDAPVSTRQPAWGATSIHASRIDTAISSRATQSSVDSLSTIMKRGFIKSIQQGTISLPSYSEDEGIDVTISTVVPSKCITIAQYRSGCFSGSSSAIGIILTVKSPNKLNIQKVKRQDLYSGWQVIEFY